MKTPNNSLFSGLENSKKIMISIVIPTYNEIENLDKLIRKIHYMMKKISFEIIIVDDNSPDGTGRIAEELSNQNGFIRVIHRPQKLGLGSALIEGINLSNSQYIIILDADFQHSPEVLSKFLETNNLKNDIIIASRFINGAKNNGLNPWRTVVSRGAKILAKILLPKIRNISDPLSGFFMFRNKIIKNSNLTGKGWKILLEILNGAEYEKVVELPYVFKPRTKGKSKLKISDYIDYLTLIRILFTTN